MSAADTFSTAPAFRPQRAAIALVGTALVAVGVFLSGFVIDEPAPYEIYMTGLIVLWAVFGLRISRAAAPLAALYILFNIGGMISMLTMKEIGDTPLYLAVSLFLALSAVFYASIIEDDERRLKLIFRAYLAGALITALLGILGYFHAFPGAAVFTRYDRAMGAFQDPNVFGPYLVLPALYLMHGLLTGRTAAAPARIAGLLVLTLGIFLSFSRAAWGLYAFSILMLVLVMLLKERTGAFRLRILVLALIGMLVLVAAVVIAMQIPQVEKLFTVRAHLVQEYDGARLGRFERHKIGFLMALDHPLGIGPLVFGTLYGEDTHNIWLKAVMDYGWIGFISYVGLIAATLSLGFRGLLRDRPWQPYLMIGWIVLLGHSLIGFVIDTDHWRHFYLIMGIVWGCIGLEARYGRGLANKGEEKSTSVSGRMVGAAGFEPTTP